MPRDVISDGDGHLRPDTQNKNAVSTQSAVRKRGRPRKANGLLMPNGSVPTEAPISETRQETVAGGGHRSVDIHHCDASPSSNEIDGSAVVADGMGQAPADVQKYFAHPSASNSDIPSMAGGRGHEIGDIQTSRASPNSMPPRKRGLLRNAISPVIPMHGLPTGALNTETQRETAAGGGHEPYDTQRNGVSPSSSEIGSNAVADGMGIAHHDTHQTIAHPPASHSQIHPLDGGGGQEDHDVQHQSASPNPMPSRKRGRPRKATVILNPVEGMPTGALNTEMQRETAAGGGHVRSDTHPESVSPSSSEIGSNVVADGVGHHRSDARKECVHPSALHSETPAQEPVGGGQFIVDAHDYNAFPSSHTAVSVLDIDSGGEVRAIPNMISTVELPDLAPIVNALIMNQKKRIFCIRSQNRQNNATLAFVRMYLGWSPDLGEKEQKKILDRAQSIVSNVEKGKPLSAEDQPIGDACSLLILSSVAAREPLDEMRKGIEKAMTALVKQLPVWSWAKDVKGFGAVGLGVVIGEAGDLSNYSNPGKLWKRMGLAPFHGKSARTWRIEGGLTADDWTWFGYKPSRRSEMWNRAPSLIKQQISKVLDENGEDTGERIATGPYGEAYLNRKRHELERNPEISKIHAHNRAQRYMEKRLLKHLWQAWRRQPISDIHVDSKDAA